jgi:hypothetical protein
MRFRHTMSVFLVVSVLGFAAPALKEQSQVSRYYPTAKDTTWVYSINGTDYTLTIADVKSTANETLLTIAQVTKEGKRILSSKERVTKDGVFIVQNTSLICDPPHQKLNHSLKTGETWKYEIPATGDSPGDTYTFKVGAVEEMTLPTGTFKALRINVESSRGERWNFTDWYAPDVGMVRRKTSANEWTLKSFTKGKPATP